jgi:50S ribosomal protein L16 3-hydroxylase
MSTVIEPQVQPSAPRLRTASAVTLPDASWRDFVREVWERKPVALPRAMDGPLVDTAELLNALKAGADGLRAGLAHAQFTVWVGGRKQTDMLPFLPQQQDSSLQGYLDRVHALVEGAEFTVLLANPHLFSRTIKHRLRGFLGGLFEQAGYPCGGWDSGIFLGRYSVTPFGVHRGQMSVMTFPVVGRKRFLMWPRGYGEAHADIRDAVKFEAHLPAATDRSVVAGDLLYWPADVWHVADDEPDFTAALNVGFWWDRPPLNQALLTMSEVLAEEVDADPGAEALRNDEGDRQITLQPGATTLPPELARALDIVHRATRGGAVQSALQQNWLAFRSGAGVRDLAPLPEAAPGIEPGCRLRPSAPHMVLMSSGADGELLFAAGGHACRLPGDARLQVALAPLSAGQPIEFHPQLLPEGELRASLFAALSLALGAGAIERA